jgi:hypothetical protein
VFESKSTFVFLCACLCLAGAARESEAGAFNRCGWGPSCPVTTARHPYHPGGETCCPRPACGLARPYCGVRHPLGWKTCRRGIRCAPIYGHVRNESVGYYSSYRPQGTFYSGY